jgi:hypothetical protein
MDTFVLKGKPFFSVECSCGEGTMHPLTTEQLARAKGDLVAILRMLPKDAQNHVVEFYTKHRGEGHDARPTLCEIAPLDQGDKN